METNSYYEFGPFSLKPAEYLLLRDGHPIAVTDRAFAVLVILVDRAGHLVKKQDLMNAVWKDCIVEECNIATTIFTLRKVLGDDRNGQKYIHTVSKHGYRFVSDVRKLTEPAAIEEDPNASTSTGWHRQTTIVRESSPRIWGDSSSLLLSIAAVFLLGITITWIFAPVPSSKAAAQEIRSLAVLPFHDTSSDSVDAQLSIGITDTLITELGSIGNIAIRPMSSVMKYAGRQIDAVSAGREQKVDGLVIGTIDESNGQMRIAAQLVRVSDGSLLWSGTFDKPFDQAFDLEAQIEDNIAQALYPQKTAVHAAMPQPPDPEAYRLYLEGRYYWNKRSEEGLRKSVEYFQNATLKDPRFALAYSGLADAYTSLAINNIESPQKAYPEAEKAANKALEINNRLAEAHASLGKAYLSFERNWSRAESEFKRAIELDASFSVTHAWYATDLASEGKVDLALNEALRAQYLDPLSLSVNDELAREYYYSRKYDQAIACYRHIIDLDQNFSKAHLRLGETYLAQRNYSDAIRELKEAKRLLPENTEADGLLGYTQATQGNPAAAREILRELKLASNRGYISRYSVSLVYLGLGDRDAALDWLAKAYEERDSGLVHLNVDPLFDSIRSDSRFISLLTKIGLPQLQAQNVQVALKNPTF